MNRGKKLIAGLTMAGLVMQSVLAGTAAADQNAAAALPPGAFGQNNVDVLTAQEMEDTTGKLGPLALALAIAGVDLALIGIFWGPFMNHYAGAGSCANCSDNVFMKH